MPQSAVRFFVLLICISNILEAAVPYERKSVAIAAYRDKRICYIKEYRQLRKRT